MAAVVLRCTIIFLLSSLSSEMRAPDNDCNCNTAGHDHKSCEKDDMDGTIDDIENNEELSGEIIFENLKHVAKCLGRGRATMHNGRHFSGSVVRHQRGKLSDHQLALPSGNGTRNENDDVYVQIPGEALLAALGNDDNEVNSSILWFQGGLFPVEEANSSLLNDRVVSIELGYEISGLSNKVNISFHHHNASLGSATCVFWDILTDNNGSKSFWNSSGCSTAQANGEVLCSCDHLSFFAVLLSPSYEEEASLSAYSVWLLTLLSQIGCGVSVCFMALVITYHVIYRFNNSEHCLSIHIHLCVALLGLNLSFLINESLAALNIHGLCVFIAAATHYTLLCTISWFAMEGFHLYLLVIRVFNIYVKRYLLKLALLGWGVPAVVVISLLSSSQYGRYNIYNHEGSTETMCYLTESVLTIITYSFFVLVFLGNLLVSMAVVVQVVRARQLSPALQEKRITWRDIFSLLGVFWLLGVSWGVLLFQFGSLKEAALYIFCIFNSLHGLFVAVRYFTLFRQPKSAVTTATDTS